MRRQHRPARLACSALTGALLTGLILPLGAAGTAAAHAADAPGGPVGEHRSATAVAWAQRVRHQLVSDA
ncbi:hypothetical protein, partial [Streptomyces sp. SM14]|uniref:hypothetical protein n=1 Tax=Streptomyces sp. SM14 TaxID=1736045 RepID=UPI0035BBB239